MLPVATYWRTKLTMRQIAALFGTSKSAAARITGDPASNPALRARRRFGSDAVLIVDGTPVPTRDHGVAAKSKNYRYSTDHQVVIDADTRLVVAVGTPSPGHRNDSVAFGESGVDHATVIADGGYRGTRVAIPQRRKDKHSSPAEWKEDRSAWHRQSPRRTHVRGNGAREHVARLPPAR